MLVLDPRKYFLYIRRVPLEPIKIGGHLGPIALPQLPFEFDGQQFAQQGRLNNLLATVQMLFDRIRSVGDERPFEGLTRVMDYLELAVGQILKSSVIIHWSVPYAANFAE